MRQTIIDWQLYIFLLPSRIRVKRKMRQAVEKEATFFWAPTWQDALNVGITPIGQKEAAGPKWSPVC